MTKDALEEVRLMGLVTETTSKVGRARQRRKLSDAIAAESTPVGQERAPAPVSAAASIRSRQGRRRRTYVVGAAAAIVVAAGVAIPLSLRTVAPAAGRGATRAATRPTKSAAAPTMELDSYRLRLPSSYRLTAATTVRCPVSGVGFITPDSTPPGGTAWTAQVPVYASQVAVNANAEGGCITMVLAPPYTPSAADPDPEAGIFESTQPVHVGPYEGRAGTWATVAKDFGVATQQAALYVQIPVAGGQDQDLVVSANNLSESALVALVANGLSVAQPSPSSGSTRPTSGNTSTRS